MRKFCILLFVILCVSAALAQVKPAEAACSSLAYSTQQSCETFNTMLRAGDPDFIYIASEGSTSYVCFEEADTFFVIYFAQPSTSGWKQNPKENVQAQRGRARFMLYTSGVNKEYETATFEWYRFIYDDQEPSVRYDNSKGDLKGSSFNIDGSEVQFDYSYTTVKNLPADRGVKIRMSTKMFVDTIQVPGDKPVVITSKGQCTVYGSK